MVSRAILEAKGITAEAWKKKLAFTREVTMEQNTMNPPPIQDVVGKDKLRRLHSIIRSHVKAGRDYNLDNYRTIQALDIIWEAPFRQVTPTLLMDLIRKGQLKDGPGAEADMLSALKSIGLGLEDVFTDTGEIDPKSGQKVMQLNVPAFFTVLVPLVRAYLEIRRAKIVNDRNLKPFHKFESPVSDEKMQLKCEILTSRIEVMRQQYGYLDTLKQAVFQMLLYGSCLQFTMEAWHHESSMRHATAQDVERLNEGRYQAPAGESPTVDPENPDGPEKLIKEGDEITFTKKEGLRYYHPHPSRTFFDLAYPAWTFNTDTGCSYAGHWRVQRMKEIIDNPAYFNKDRITYGSQSNGLHWAKANVNFFNSCYNTCCMDWPTPPSVPEGQDREAYLADNCFYNEQQGEKAVVVTEYRMKLIPSEYGLGDYDHPIWARFVLAGDDSTIIYAEPLCYQGVIVYKYHGDDRRTEDASLGLQLLPSQDMLGNLLSQYIYAARQNLTNITLVDKNVVGEPMMKKLKNMGERMIRGLNIFEYDSKQLFRMQTSVPQAFFSHRFPVLDTNSILQCIKLVLDLAERVLQFSAQEVAQSASHEQTRKEIEVIMSSTTNILQFTGVAVDQAMAAQANQLYEATMNYADDDIYAFIPLDHQVSEADLKTLGITYVTSHDAQGKNALVRAKRSALQLIYFAIVPSYYERKNNADTGRIISEMVRDWFMNNPIGQGALGPNQLVDLFNQVWKLLGLPMERPIRNVGMTAPEQQQQIMAELQAQLQAQMQEVQKGMIPVMDAVHNTQAQVAQIAQFLNIPLTNQPQSNAQPQQSPANPGGNPQAPAMAV